MYTRPVIVGSDVSGVVWDIGEDVKKFEIGDAVFACLPPNRIGAMAEYCIVSEDFLVHKPKSLS